MSLTKHVSAARAAARAAGGITVLALLLDAPASVTVPLDAPAVSAAVGSSIASRSTPTGLLSAVPTLSHNARNAATNAPAAAGGVGAKRGTEKNLLLNGDLRAGSDDSPDHWRSEAWEQTLGMTTFRWSHPLSAPGELRVTNHKPNDARWVQNLTLAPGWFHLSAKIRAENVSDSGQGASLSILEGAIGSADLRGTTEWQRRGFYLKVGPRGADVEVACRLGGFGSLNTGTAICADLTAVSVAAPPPGVGPIFDLDQVRRQYTTPPVGRPWTLAGAFAFTLALALFGWTMLGETNVVDPASANPR